MNKEPNYDAFYLILVWCVTMGLSVVSGRILEWPWYVAVIIIPTTATILTVGIIKNRRKATQGSNSDNNDFAPNKAVSGDGK